MDEITGFNTVRKHGNILLTSCLQFVNEMLPVFIVFLLENLLLFTMFELS